ncbi:MAG: GTPase, partial [Candidatus Muproteobacteria bacterium RBG_16_64_11]
MTAADSQKTDHLVQRVEAYSAWRETLSGAIADLRAWVQTQDLGDTQVDQRLEHVLSLLRDDKLYIAFVAEFSRGKSELINAIFFAHFGTRVLPSSAGRTTMCPTELLYEAGTEPVLKLLPIETRKTGTAIAEYRNFPEEWQNVPLDPHSSEAMAQALAHIAEVKHVPREEAQTLGLHIAENETEVGMRIADDGLVEIPRWRHAVINLPHPLLEHGLVILDTPGLNALGAEPELTLNLLPNAQAVLYVLAADTGVTKTDIQVWHDHIGSRQESAGRGRLVVLNKIDGLWDGLRPEDEVEHEIARQVRETAETLGIPEANVFPVSAQKALLGKVKNDVALIARSRIEALERALAEELIPARREIVRATIGGDMVEIIKMLRAILAQRLRGVYEHMEELSGLNGRNMEVIEHMMQKVRGDKEVFELSLQRFQATRSVFTQQTNVLYSHLNLKTLDTLILETRKNMAESLTTVGLKGCMESFFRRAYLTMEAAAKQAQEIKTMMEGVYHKFQEEYGLANVRPGGLSMARYLREIRRLETKHEQYMKGAHLVFTEQQILTRRFFDSAVSKVRAIFKMANRETDQWLKNILSPMEAQVREHQIELR